MEEYDYEQLVKATENFSPSRLIGKGSHGLVYKGILRENKLVAIKKSSPSVEAVEALHDHSKLNNEIQILSSLCENPYMIKILGISHDYAKNKLLVMELMPNGSLHELLHAASTPPTWPKRVEMALQIARAVQFLHEGLPLVIHRDIKSANILFDSNWNAKLADFGLAVIQNDELLVDSPSQVSQPAGTIGYLDPCYTTPTKLSTKTDVFSFGVVLLEIISGRKVIDVGRTPASIADWAISLIKEGHIITICDQKIVLPMYMQGTIKHILHVAVRCISSEEEYRPSIREIVMEIKSCYIERVRYPIWMSFLRSVILMRNRRKLSRQERAKCATIKGDIIHSEISRAKLAIIERGMAEI